MIKGRRYHFSLGGEWGIRSFSGNYHPPPPGNVAKIVTKFREAENEESSAKAQFSEFYIFLMQNLQRNENPNNNVILLKILENFFNYFDSLKEPNLMKIHGTFRNLLNFTICLSQNCFAKLKMCYFAELS
jgi:hypothetical protein